MRTKSMPVLVCLGVAIVGPAAGCKSAVEKSSAKIDQAQAILKEEMDEKFAHIEATQKRLRTELDVPASRNIPFMDYLEPLCDSQAKLVQDKAEELRTLKQGFEGILAGRAALIVLSKDRKEKAKDLERGLDAHAKKECLILTNVRLFGLKGDRERYDQWLAQTIAKKQAHPQPFDIEKRYLKALLVMRDYRGEQQKRLDRTLAKVEALFKGE